MTTTAEHALGVRKFRLSFRNCSHRLKKLPPHTEAADSNYLSEFLYPLDGKVYPHLGMRNDGVRFL